MIVILEPERAPGFVSGGYRYQHSIGDRLSMQGLGDVRAVAPAGLAAAVAAVRAGEPRAAIVVDGLFAVHAPLPADIIALLHMVPQRADWCRAPVPVIATSATTAAALGDRAHALVVRPGLDACFLPPPPGPRAPGPLRVTGVGTVSPGKNQLPLVQALASASVRCELTLLGDATAHPDYVAAVHAAARGVTVHWRGVVTAADVAATLQASELFVSASRSESFGMAAAEAAACGVPVFAYDTGEFATFVRDGQNGWLLPANAREEEFRHRLHALLAAPDRLAGARAAAVRPPLLDWDGVTAQFVRACEQLMPRRAP